jgi:hypothetical protein
MGVCRNVPVQRFFLGGWGGWFGGLADGLGGGSGVRREIGPGGDFGEDFRDGHAVELGSTIFTGSPMSRMNTSPPSPIEPACRINPAASGISM